MKLLISLLGFSFSINAAQPLLLENTAITTLQQHFLLTKAGISSSGDSLQWLRETKDENQTTHVRMQQLHRGFLVFGGYAIVHDRGHEVSLSGALYTGLDQEIGKPDSNFIKKADLVLQEFIKKYSGAKNAHITPLVFIDEKNKAHWAYKINFLMNTSGDLPQQPTVIMDAQTQVPLLRWDTVKTGMHPVKSQGFGGNVKIGKYHYGTNYPYLDISRDDETGKCFMENSDVRVIDLGSTNGDLPIQSEAKNFECKEESSAVFWTMNGGYDLINGAYSPINDALYVGSVIKSMYRDWYGVTVLTHENGAPMQMVMRVHYGKNYSNAFWANNEMTFGDGGDAFYPLVSLGIAAHEISHGFTEQNSGLIYVKDSGGLDEAFSDMAAQTAEYFATGSNHWKIGSEVLKENTNTEAIRYMDEPSRDGISVDTMKVYRERIKISDMNPHYSSGIYNKLFYLMSIQKEWNPRVAFAVMLKANQYYWTPYSKFDGPNGACCGVLHAAKDLGLGTQGIVKAMSAIGLDYRSCKK